MGQPRRDTCGEPSITRAPSGARSASSLRARQAEDDLAAAVLAWRDGRIVR